MNEILEKGTTFIWENARLLERAIFEYRFQNRDPSRIIDILRTYQGDDGGFGHALEPDLRAPDSHPLFVEFALNTLHACQLRDPVMANRACDFVAQHANLEKGIPTIFPSARLYPRAGHWHNTGNEEPSFDRLVGLVGLINWQGIEHPWLKKAVDACLEYLNNARFDDAHTISTAFCLLESLKPTRTKDQLFKKLSEDLLRASYFSLEAPVRTYALTPLNFAPTPESFCRPIFSDAQIAAHLDDLVSQQQDDGGWSIQWQPPGEMAQCEWRGYKTVMALSTLRAYGRI